MKIHADFMKFASLNFDSTKYIASPSFGVNRFMLDRVGNEKARATTIVEYQPNSKFPKHTHIGGEEFIILKGTFKDQYGEFPKGTYVRNPVGSQHAPWVDDDGCVMMVKLLQMTDSTNDNVIEPLYVSYDNDDDNNNNQKSNKVSTDYGTVLDMYSNPVTGEQVSMCWIEPNTVFPPTNEAVEGGEELFIIQGSVDMKTTSPSTTSYKEWGWLRFPPKASSTTTANDDNGYDRSTLTAGPNGAQVYRKVGHLTSHALKLEKIKIDFDTEELIASEES